MAPEVRRYRRQKPGSGGECGLAARLHREATRGSSRQITTVCTLPAALLPLGVLPLTSSSAGGGFAGEEVSGWLGRVSRGLKARCRWRLDGVGQRVRYEGKEVGDLGAQGRERADGGYGD